MLSFATKPAFMAGFFFTSPPSQPGHDGAAVVSEPAALIGAAARRGSAGINIVTTQLHDHPCIRMKFISHA
jgi:hypothetical protein